MSVKLGDISYITKLAGFEHTKYIQGHISHIRTKEYDIPLFIGKTVRNGKIDKAYDWYLPHEISDKLPRSQLTKRCLVMPYVGSLGDLAIFEADERCHLGSNIAKIELNENCGYYVEFIYYFIKSPLGQRLLFKDVQGAIQKNITMESIRNIELPNVSLNVQKAIVKVLEQIDSKISINTSICSELEAMTRLIYDYWFVQFDFPDEHGRPYKSSGGKMVWNDKLKRHIPAAWDVVKLGDICESMIAGDWGKSEPTGNYTKEVFCIRGADIPDVQCGSKGKMPTRYILPNNFETKRLTENNLVVEISGGSPIQSTGRIAIVTKQLLDLYDNRIICTNFCKALKIKSECVYLIYFMWRSLYDNRQMFSFEIGTTGIKNLDIAYILENVYIAIPPQNLLNSFNQRIEKFLNCMFSSSHENESLTSLRDFLLPMLMNGQVTVK